MMRIGINATCINDRPSGARQRFVGLLTHLALLKPDSEFVVFEPEDCRMAGWFAGIANIKTRATPLSSTSRTQRFIRGIVYWRHVFAREQFDVFEALHMPATRAPNGKTLLTIHDVRELYQSTGWLGRQLFRLVLKHSLWRADRVVTVSHAMRDEILAFSKTTPVCVVCNGLDASSYTQVEPAAQEQLAQRLQLPERYLLAVGHFELRKNYETLIEAMVLLDRAGTPVPLVIVGNDSGERLHIEVLAASAGLSSNICLLSGLSDDELRCVYRGAMLFVFPSRYEGFGIPLLEAMANGLPVAASNIPVFHEILKDAGVYFDPDSANEMASAIKRLMGSEEIREQLVARGAARVRDFEFRALASEMATIYESLVQAT